MVLALSMRTHTPIGYWWDMPIGQLLEWYVACYDLVEEMDKEAEKEVERAWQVAGKRNTP